MTIQSSANDHGQVLVLSVFTQQLKVYLFTTPALHLFFHSSFPRPAGWGGQRACNNVAMKHYPYTERRPGPGGHWPVLSTEPAQAVVRILDGFMLNNQHSEVIEPENMILILQYQSWLLMIMRIYNDDDIFVLAKHQVLVKMFPIQSSTEQNTSPCVSPSWTRRSSR